MNLPVPTDFSAIATKHKNSIFIYIVILAQQVRIQCQLAWVRQNVALYFVFFRAK